MLFLARSHSRVPVLTDPSIRPLPGQQGQVIAQSRQTIYKCHLQAGHQMAIWRQAQTTGNWALEPGRHSSQIVRGGEWPLVERKRELKLLLCFTILVKVHHLHLLWESRKRQRGHSLYSPVRMMLAEGGARSHFHCLAHKAKENTSRKDRGLRVRGFPVWQTPCLTPSASSPENWSGFTYCWGMG